jgi:uncharacterized protein (TIGR03435 family)
MIALTLCSAGLCISQSVPSFEAASVKASREVEERDPACWVGPGVLEYRCESSAGPLTGSALDLLPYQYKRDPTGVKYRIDAKLSSPAPQKKIDQMLLSLLVERCRLKYHFEKQLMDAYVITLAGKGPGLRLAARENVPGNAEPLGFSVGLPGDKPPTFPGTVQVGRRLPGDMAELLSTGATIKKLAKTLSYAWKAPVVDETGLTGSYDYAVSYPFLRSEFGADPHPIWDVMLKQLGLKVTARKVQLDVLVIDHFESNPTN